MLFSVDVEKQENGLLDVYIESEGSSGLHYKDVTAEKIGVLLAEEIKNIDDEGCLKWKMNLCRYRG